MTINATDARVALAFNEWMRRYIEEPERYAHELTTVRKFLATEAQGKVPDYGAECARYLANLLLEV